MSGKGVLGDALKLGGKSVDEMAAIAKGLKDQAALAAKAGGGAPVSGITEGLFKQTDDIIATGSKQLDDWLQGAGKGATKNSPAYKQMELIIARNAEVALEKAAKQMAKEADEAAAKLAKETADLAAKLAAKEATEKAAKEAAEKAKDDAAEATAKASTASAKAAQDVADEAAAAAEKAAKEAKEKAAKATEDAAKAAKTTDEAAKASAKASDDAAKASTEAAETAAKKADDAKKAAAEASAKASDDVAVVVAKEGKKIDDVAASATSAAAKGAKTADEIAEAAAKRADAIKKAKMAVASGIGGGIAAASLANYLKKDKKEFNIIAIEDISEVTSAKGATGATDTSSNSNIIYKTMITIQVDDVLSKKASIKIEETDCVPIIPVEEYNIEDIIANKKIIIITPVKIITPGKKGKMTYYTTFQKELELVLKDVADNTVKAGTAAVINTAVETGKDIGKDTLKSAGLGDILDKGLGEFFGKGFDQILGMVGLTRETFFYILGGLAVLFVLYVLYNISRIFF
jgi:hypothetical protein